MRRNTNYNFEKIVAHHCLDFFSDFFLFLNNQDVWVFEGPVSGEKQKNMTDDSIVAIKDTIMKHLALTMPLRGW